MTETQDHASQNHAVAEPSLSLGLGDLPAGIQAKNDGLLSLKDIEIRLDANYSRLQRFANADGIGEYLGAVDVPGAKGPRYEPRAVEVFRRLLAASDAKELTPGTAVAWLKLNEETKSKESKPTANETAITERNGITEKPLSGHSADLTTRGLAAIFSPMVSVLQEVRDLLHDFRSGKAQIAAPTAPPQDRLLTAEEAAGLLACKPRSVGHRVPPVSENPRRYRESDVLRYIQQLEPKSPK